QRSKHSPGTDGSCRRRHVRRASLYVPFLIGLSRCLFYKAREIVRIIRRWQNLVQALRRRVPPTTFSERLRLRKRKLDGAFGGNCRSQSRPRQSIYICGGWTPSGRQRCPVVLSVVPVSGS